MTLLGNIKKARAWEWVLLVIAIALVVYSFGCLHGCAGARTVVETISRRGTEILVGTVVGAGVALAVGATGIGLVLGPLAAAGAVVFATPECGGGPGAPPPPPHPLFSMIQIVIGLGILYVLWIRRERIMDGVRSGTFREKLAHWSHAFLGTKRPGGSS